MKLIHTEQLSRGEAGTDETIAIMTALAHDAFEHSRAVQQTGPLLRMEEESEWGALKNLYAFLAGRVIFKPDAPGIEEIRHPESMLKTIGNEGFIEADCDDRATLAAALLLSMKMPAYFIVMTNSHQRGFHHVYYGSELSVLPGRVIPFDPQAGTAPGEHTPHVRKKVYEV